MVKIHSDILKVFYLACLGVCLISCYQGKIDRKAVVLRHNVIIHEVDTLNSLSLGNGRFAMTMDVTGLQTFPIEYSKGVPLGTLSEWGWHSFPPKRNYSIDETLQTVKAHGREVPYAIQWPANSLAGEPANYIRQNPHRIHLATIGWYIEKSDDSEVIISDIKKIDQKLDIWKGELISKFEVEGIPVEVTTLIDQNNDILGVRVKSKLLSMNRLGLSVRYPYPTNQFLDEASNYDTTEYKRIRVVNQDQKNITIQRILDSTKYYTGINSSSDLKAKTLSNTGYTLMPESKSDTWTIFVSFSKNENYIQQQDFDQFRSKIAGDYEVFWNSGAMIDFGNVTDPRAKELERRMILSLYLTKINCGGNSFPQETGLTYNSWYGRPHMEMAWWHGVHFALWGRPQVLEKQMDWYLRNDSIARLIAQRQGFSGVRWQKMTDNNGGETVSSVGSYLIWQQPHIIYFSELLYKIHPTDELLKKYYKLVEESAEFMADFAWYDSSLNRYILGPGVMPAQERFDPQTNFNPSFEVAYWRWGLETAQLWRERSGEERNVKWDRVLKNLSPLPQLDGLYLAAESAPDSYSEEKYMTDHPIVLGIYGMLSPTEGLDMQIMENTFQTVLDKWQWDKTWGWDFPLAAMTATRLGFPDKAVDVLLMPIETNTYLKNGHNFQNETLRIYLPGNGGILTALALMAEVHGELEKPASGFPSGWDVKYEGFNRMP